jgi:ribosomal protein S18 acetylase RimI-like enzyme
MTASDSLQVIYQLTEAHLGDLLRLYQTTWWGPQRQVNDIRRMLAHSDLVIGLENSATQALVGFCRLLTDGVYRAVLYDVMVADAYRGQGLGQRLVDEATAHPMMQSVEVISLFCKPDMVSFYERWDFVDQGDQIRLMHREQP